MACKGCGRGESLARAAPLLLDLFAVAITTTETAVLLSRVFLLLENAQPSMSGGRVSSRSSRKSYDVSNC